MTITLAEFGARLRSLYNIDHADVPWMTREEYSDFARDPARLFTLAGDEAQTRIWAVVEWRNRARGMHRDMATEHLDKAAGIVLAAIATLPPFGDRS